jgi:hypothetical protein
MPVRREHAGRQEQEAASEDELVDALDRGGESGRAMELGILSALLGPLHEPRWSIDELELEFGDQLLGFAQALNSLREAEVVEIDDDRVVLTDAARRMSELHEL